MKYYYRKGTLKTKLEIGEKVVELEPLELINVFLKYATYLNSIQEIECAIYKEITKEENMPQWINLFNINKEENTRYYEFMGEDRALKRIKEETEYVEIAIQLWLLPHKNEYLQMRKGNKTVVTKRIPAFNLYDNEYEKDLYIKMKEFLAEIQSSISREYEYQEVWEGNSILSFIWKDIEKCIKYNIVLSKCEICQKYFLSSGRIGKTGNKYCSKECSNVKRKEEMRKRRSTQ